MLRFLLLCERLKPDPRLWGSYSSLIPAIFIDFLSCLKTTRPYWKSIYQTSVDFL